jgi:hypothetical protein
MKKSIVLLLVLIMGATLAAAAEPADEAKAIKAAVGDYVEGWHASDAERMARALHPNLSKGTVKSVPESSTEYVDFMTAENLIAYTKHNQKWVEGKKARSMKIVYQDERIAVVHAVSDDFYDLCSLAKVNGEWKIVQVLWAPNSDGK